MSNRNLPNNECNLANLLSDSVRWRRTREENVVTKRPWEQALHHAWGEACPVSECKAGGWVEGKVIRNPMDISRWISD